MLRSALGHRSVRSRWSAIIQRRLSTCRAQFWQSSLDALAAIGSYSSRRRCSTRAATTGGTTMTRATLITTFAALAMITGAGGVAWSQETLKVAIPQRGAWDAGVAELGERGGIFKKHGLDL